MTNTLIRFSVVCALATFLFGIAGCTSNIEHIAAPADTTPESRVFDGPFDKVWGAAQGVLSSEATFKVLDKSSAIMVTEFKTIDSKELSIIGTTFLGKTYKNNYTVNFVPVGTQKTEVRINVAVQAQQVGFFTREEDQPQVKSYLRKKLFDQIASSLRK